MKVDDKRRRIRKILAIAARPGPVRWCGSVHHRSPDTAADRTTATCRECGALAPLAGRPAVTGCICTSAWAVFQLCANEGAVRAVVSQRAGRLSAMPSPGRRVYTGELRGSHPVTISAYGGSIFPGTRLTVQNVDGSGPRAVFRGRG